MLAYEASRHPELAETMANVAQMSDDQIKSIKVRLPWMRQALLQLKHAKPSDELMAHVLASVIDSHVPDPVGDMRQWIGSTTFVRVGRSYLEICSGQLLWFGETGVWIDTIYAPTIDPLFRTNTTSCGQISRLGYYEALRNRVNGTPVTSTIDSPMSGVRFYRP